MASVSDMLVFRQLVGQGTWYMYKGWKKVVCEESSASLWLDLILVQVLRWSNRRTTSNFCLVTSLWSTATLGSSAMSSVFVSGAFFGLETFVRFNQIAHRNLSDLFGLSCSCQIVAKHGENICHFPTNDSSASWDKTKAGSPDMHGNQTTVHVLDFPRHNIKVVLGISSLFVVCQRWCQYSPLLS